MTKRILTHRTSGHGTHEFARMLRKEMTLPERLLWERLRKRLLNGFRFRRQHPIGPYIADFYCNEANLAIELDGPIHLSIEQRDRDKHRTLAFKDHGIRILRFKNAEVERDIESVLSTILNELKHSR